MPNVNGSALKTYREKTGFTLEALEAASRVSKSTINKIECGKRPSVRLTTVEQLARALGIKKDVLLQDGSGERAVSSESPASELPYGSELRVVINDQCRNALFLASLRYRIPDRDIINLASFLFVWAAETSLRRRKQALDEITQKLDEVSGIRTSQLPHLSHRLHNNVDVEWHIDSENASIKKRDLFARQVEEDGSDINPILANNYNDETSNPFTTFLKSLAAEVSEVAEFEGMSSYGWPDYSVCKEQALLIVGGDEVAADIILTGGAPLHQMPTDILGKGKAQERASWVRAISQERSPNIDFDL